MGSQVPPKWGAAPQFLIHVCCGQTAGWMKTPLGTEVDLGPGRIVLDGVPALRKTSTAAPHLFMLVSIVNVLDNSNNCTTEQNTQTFTIDHAVST